MEHLVCRITFKFGYKDADTISKGCTTVLKVSSGLNPIKKRRETLIPAVILSLLFHIKLKDWLLKDLSLLHLLFG